MDVVAILFSKRDEYEMRSSLQCNESLDESLSWVLSKWIRNNQAVRRRIDWCFRYSSLLTLKYIDLQLVLLVVRDENDEEDPLSFLLRVREVL